jgi:hypothetical protein
MSHWLLFLLLSAASAQIFMVVKYDTLDHVPHNLFNFSLSVVEMNVTLLGCAEGYWASVRDDKLVCSECVCSTFYDTRYDTFDLVY